MPKPGDPKVVAGARIERRVQLWMRAYPRRWRQERGEELLGLVVDLAGPDARRLGADAAFDLVRGGLATRWREHPPLHTLLLYRLFDRRIPVAYRSWAIDDINGFWYPMRRFLWNLWAMLPVLVLTQPGGIGAVSVSMFGIVALVVVFSMFIGPEGFRNQARRKHIEPRFGELPVVGALVAWDVPRERATARSMLTWAIVLLGVAGAASMVTVAFALKVLLLTNLKWIKPTRGPGLFWESGPGMSSESVVAPVGGRWVVAMVVLVLAVLLGALGAELARRRLDRLLGERPVQPYRVLRAVRPTDKAKVLFWAMVIVVVSWLEVSGRFVLGPSVVLGAVALLLLPGAVLALVVARRTEAPDLAGSDVWWIATRGRLPAVDRPARGLRPLPDTHAPEVRNGAVHG